MDADIVVGGTVVHDEDRHGMGVSFECPHCRTIRIGVFFSNPVDGKPPSDDFDAQHLWYREGTGFDDLTLSPSVDASGHGHWHGHIRDGEVL